MNKPFLYIILFCSSCFVYNVAHAQLSDLARLEYAFIPSTRSEDQYTRLRLALNYPIKVKEDCYFVVGTEYARVILNLNEEYPFDTNIIERLHIIDLNLGYTFKTSEYWRIGLQLNPRIASTLNNYLSMDDVFLNGGVFAIHDKTKDPAVKRPFRWVLGLTYNTTVGIPVPLPFISYYREINDKWSYTAGVPKSNLKYRLSKKINIQAYTSLDGYFANLQREININNRIAENISLSIAVGGLGFEYFLTDHLVAYTYTGFTFRLNNRFRDSDREDIFELNSLNAFYLRTGIKFKI